MNFEVPDDVIALSFEEYPGLQVTADSVSLGRILDLSDEAETLRNGTGGSQQARELIAEFAGALRSWNLTRGETPVPMTTQGVLSLKPRFATTMMLAWFDAIAGSDVESGPLDQGSENGARSGPAPFVPTEVL